MKNKVSRIVCPRKSKNLKTNNELKKDFQHQICQQQFALIEILKNRALYFVVSFSSSL